MKVIKYNWTGFYNPPYTESEINRIFSRVDNTKYKFELSDKPDYLICSRIVNLDEFANYGDDVIRIFYNGENTQPDFHTYDYIISFDYNLKYKDRFCWFYHCVNFLDDLTIPQLNKETAKSELLKKKLFCNFSYSHDRNDKARLHYLNLLQSYKKVSIIGTLYNDGIPPIKDWIEKKKFQRKCKFSLIVEASRFSGGLITEKIFHALQAQTIPIYLGEDDIRNIVNPNRIINIKDYKTDSELLNRIIEIDNNDELFCEILSQPSLFDSNLLITMDQKLSKFLESIFSQNKQDARRRPAIEYERNKHLFEYPIISQKYRDAMNSKRFINRVLRKFHLMLVRRPK